MKRVETAISRLMPDIDGKRVLEPACGCAEFSIAATAHAAEVVCFDLDDQRLNPEATHTERLRFEIMDGDAAREEPEYLNVLNNPDFEVIYEQHGWEHAREVIGKFTVPDDGKEYMLLFTISKDKENPTAFANTALSVMLGANLKSRERTCQNSQKLGCNVTVSEDGQNHFWLLKRK